MKKLIKKPVFNGDTIEKFYIPCECSCSCSCISQCNIVNNDQVYITSDAYSMEADAVFDNNEESTYWQVE